MLYNITHYRLIQITSSTITPVIGGHVLHAPQCSWQQLYECLGELMRLHDPLTVAPLARLKPCHTSFTKAAAGMSSVTERSA